MFDRATCECLEAEQLERINLKCLNATSVSCWRQLSSNHRDTNNDKRDIKEKEKEK
jgi:hypothetical protein